MCTLGNVGCMLRSFGGKYCSDGDQRLSNKHMLLFLHSLLVFFTGLMKLITDHCPRAIKEQTIKNYFNRKIAIDASMSLYQFLIAVRTGPDASNLTNEFGDVTSHLQGMFYRTIRMMTNGIKPVYVFDGKPPQLKAHEVPTPAYVRLVADNSQARETTRDESENRRGQKSRGGKGYGTCKVPSR